MEIILHIGIAQFVFAALLLLTKQRKALSDYVLGLWLLLMTIFMGLTLLKIEYPDAFWGRLQMFPFFFTIGPFLLFYVRTLTRAAPRLEFADSLHVLPFVVFSVAAVTMDSQVDEDILVGNSFQLNRLVYSVSALVSIATYVVLTFRELNLHAVNLLDLFSYTSARISLRWMRGVIFLFIATLVFTIISAMVNVSTGALTINPGIALFLGFTLFAFAISFFGIRQPNIFHRSTDPRFVDLIEDQPATDEPGSETEASEPEASPTEENGDRTHRYARSGLTGENQEQIAARLQAYMATQRPWLRRDLTIQDVSSEMDIPQHHLTQTINESLGKNFYTLVNEYRVEEVKARLTDPKSQHLTVLALAHDAGFNSKSTFNTVFKKMTGMTPSQYRNSK